MARAFTIGKKKGMWQKLATLYTNHDIERILLNLVRARSSALQLEGLLR